MLQPRTMIPMEEDYVTGCSICRILSKIIPYLRKTEQREGVHTFELEHTTDSRKQTIVIESEHGLLAHHMLHGFLSAIERGAIVTLHVYR
jgi:hypothetical protein